MLAFEPSLGCTHVSFKGPKSERRAYMRRENDTKILELKHILKLLAIARLLKRHRVQVEVTRGVGSRRLFAIRFEDACRDVRRDTGLATVVDVPIDDLTINDPMQASLRSMALGASSPIWIASSRMRCLKALLPLACGKTK